ncbi:MAG: DUF4956 domain-containing protein, partial [Gemmatimonadaceae bacterium]
WRWLPARARLAAIEPQSPLAATAGTVAGSGDASGNGPLQILRDAGTAVFPRHVALDAALAMVAAGLLALPVAWLYILTRQKKGYRQSVVQTLIMLPVIVAGVVMLVKNSLALAFSLAGIVAAVRFRNTLEDSKDAVFIFFATALGIAAGVQVSVAVVLSVLFSALVLWLWYTDFGHSPAALEGTRAQRRLERTLAIANRTGSFVARVDNELLKSMSPEQLDALADRAWRRRRRAAPDLDEEPVSAVDTLLRVRTTDAQAAKRDVELVLREQLSAWRPGGVVHESDGTHTVEYGIALTDGVTGQALSEAIRATGAPHVLGVELR